MIVKVTIITHSKVFYSELTIFTHLKLCLADAIHNFKWVKTLRVFLYNVINPYRAKHYYSRL